MKFITSFLLSIDKATKLDVFKLRCCLADNNLYEGIGNDMSYFACMWITLAVERKVKKLQLKMSYYDCLRIPDSFFVCDSLEELELSLDLADDDFVEVRPEKVNLPKLKRLHLSNIAIHEDYMKKIVNGCPVLKGLYAYYCSIATADVFFGSLKRLSVNYCDFDCLDISRIVPGLEYLSIAGVTIDDISSNRMHKLTEASITCDDIEEGLECDVLGSLVNVEVLEFRCSCLTDVLEKALQKSLIFDKLRRLTLGDCCMICAFGFLSSLLEHTPKLETLTLLHGFLLEECCKVNGDNGQHSREKIEWFRCKCLKKVEIFCTTSDGVPELVERVKLSTLGLNEVLVVVSTR